MKKDKERATGTSLPRNFTSDLRGRQSVRATFKLSEGCIDAISIVAAHLGIKQKSLFDHLVEDARYLTSIAREIQHVKLTKQGRIQKTFVISRRSLSSLDKVSKSYNAPRDVLVEYSVQRLLPIIAMERQKHDKRKKMLVKIASHFMEGDKLLNKVRDILGVEDPVYQKLKTVMAVYESTYNNIESFIEKGKIIEDFQPDVLEQILTASED
jgi:hypothetical protein